MIDKGQWREFGQDTGVTPLLFTMSVMGFLMTTESQDLCVFLVLQENQVKCASRAQEEGVMVLYFR